MNSEELTLPHPGVKYREFVLIPLYEITRYDFGGSKNMERSANL